MTEIAEDGDTNDELYSDEESDDDENAAPSWRNPVTILSDAVTAVKHTVSAYAGFPVDLSRSSNGNADAISSVDEDTRSRLLNAEAKGDDAVYSDEGGAADELNELPSAEDEDGDGDGSEDYDSAAELLSAEDEDWDGSEDYDSAAELLSAEDEDDGAADELNELLSAEDEDDGAADELNEPLSAEDEDGDGSEELLSAADAITNGHASTLARDLGTRFLNAVPSWNSVHDAAASTWNSGMELAGNALNSGAEFVNSHLPFDHTRMNPKPRAFVLDGVPCIQRPATDNAKYEDALAKRLRLTPDIEEMIKQLNSEERTYTWSVGMHEADGPLWVMPRSNHVDMDVELSLKFGRPDSWKMNDDVSVGDAITLDNHDVVPNKRLRINRSNSQVTLIDMSRGDNDNTVREFAKLPGVDEYYVRSDHTKYYDEGGDVEWVGVLLTLAETVWYTCRDVPTFAVYHPDHRCVWKVSVFDADNAASYRNAVTGPDRHEGQIAIDWGKAKPNEVVSIVWERDSRPDDKTPQYETIRRDIMACKVVPPCAPRAYKHHKDERWCLVYDTGLYFCPYENNFMKDKYGDTSHSVRVTYETMVAAIDNPHINTETKVELQSANMEFGLKRAVRKGVNSFVDNVGAPVKEAVVAIATDNFLRPAKTVYATAHHVATTVKDFSLNPFAKTQYIERFKALAKDHWLMWGCVTVALEIAAHHFEIDKLLNISKTALHSTIGVVALLIVDGINGGTILNEVKSMALDATTRLSKVVAGVGVASVLGAVLAGASPLALMGMLSSAAGIATLARKFAGNQAMWKALLTTILGAVGQIGPVSNTGILSVLRALLEKTHLGAMIHI